jgi:hypothetical protein
VSTHHPMSHADAAWLRMDRETNLMVTNSLMWFDETPDWDRLRANHIERIVERFPRFRQIARPGGPLGGPHWEDDPRFDPHEHFHHIALPARDQRHRTARAHCARRHAGRRGARLGALRGGHADDREPAQLWRQGHGRLPGRRRHRARPQTLADAFRAELLSLARRSRKLAI